MKVMIIIGSFKMGGAERMSINTGEELLRRGYDIYFILQRPIFEIPHSIPEERITVLRKKDKSHFFYKIFALFWGVFREARKIKPDIIIGFSRFSSFLANFTFHSRIIARLDAYPYRMNIKQRIWADMIIFSPFIKKIILPSSDMLRALEEVKPQGKKKYELIPNSITVSSILNKAAKSDSPYDFEYISAMGRFSPQKNFELLIMAFSKSSLNRRFKLVIIGDGPNRSGLEKLVEENHLKGKVVFTGKLENPFPVIKNSKFFVNPSKFESFGNVILEALLLGVPVIATNCNYGPADMVKTNYNGALISDNNYDELLVKLNEWGEDKLLLKKFSQNAYTSALNFDLEKVGNKWQHLLEDIQSY